MQESAQHLIGHALTDGKRQRVFAQQLPRSAPVLKVRAGTRIEADEVNARFAAFVDRFGYLLVRPVPRQQQDGALLRQA